MTISKIEIEQILIHLDDDARDSFLAMPREDQLLVILGMEGSNSNRLAIVEKWQIDFQREARLYREQRENKENGDDDEIMGITQKMAKIVARELAKRFDVWTWIRDRILPTVMTAIVLGLLYLVFGGKVP